MTMNQRKACWEHSYKDCDTCRECFQMTEQEIKENIKQIERCIVGACDDTCRYYTPEKVCYADKMVDDIKPFWTEVIKALKIVQKIPEVIEKLNYRYDEYNQNYEKYNGDYDFGGKRATEICIDIIKDMLGDFQNEQKSEQAV